MFLAPVPDLNVGLFILFSLFHLIVAFAIVVLTEMFILRQIYGCSLRRSLRDSFVTNLVTTILGVIFFTHFAPFDIFNSGGDLLLLMIVAYGLSVLIEGGVLFVLGRTPIKKTYRAAALANIGSYTLLGLYLFRLTDL